MFSSSSLTSQGSLIIRPDIVEEVRKAALSRRKSPSHEPDLGNTPRQHFLSTHPTNTLPPTEHTLLPILPTYPHSYPSNPPSLTLSTHPLNPPSQPTLSTHPLNRLPHPHRRCDSRTAMVLSRRRRSFRDCGQVSRSMLCADAAYVTGCGISYWLSPSLTHRPFNPP